MGKNKQEKNKVNSITDFDIIMKKEYETIKEIRKNNRIVNEEINNTGTEEKDEAAKNEDKKAQEPDNINKEIFGLCLSGGGIRSATFNLGILQSFARIGILRLIDYLSTVSGGGYIGSCLSSLLTYDKASVRWDESFPFYFNRDMNSDEREELKRLRHHSSNYLIPDRVRTNDFWGMIGSYITGFILTNSITVALVIFVAFLVNFFIKTTIDRNINLINFFLFSSLIFIVPAIIIRFFSSSFIFKEGKLSKREVIEDINGLFVGISISSVIIVGVVAIIQFVPEITDIIIGSFHGITIASVLGLLTAFVKIKKNIIKIIFQVSIILFIPYLIAELIYLFSFWNLFSLENVVVVLGWRIPVIIIIFVPLLLSSCIIKSNRISIHSFYRDKLSRAFIITRYNEKYETDSKDKKNGYEADKTGNADQNKKDKILFPNDRFIMSKLHKHYNGPYHIFNATLNIPTTKNTLFRGRKSDLFIFSKFYCGSSATGYKETDKFYNNKLTVTTAMAISGAAISPEMGMFTNPFLSFFLTIFNIRLNRWFPNPKFNDSRFRIFLQPYYFLKELFCRGTENGWHINVSDGGHFDNSGLYSLIKRRCRYIIVSDAGEDKNHFIKDLSITLRRIRIDMGASIEMDFTGIRTDEKTGYSPLHFAVGKIKYAEALDVNAYIIYIKSLVVENDPEDIISYKKQNPIFPDQTTMDQFFDEAQFESYRNLGYVSGRSLMDMHRDEKGNEDKTRWTFLDNKKNYDSRELLAFFEQLYQYYEKECKKIKEKENKKI